MNTIRLSSFVAALTLGAILAVPSLADDTTTKPKHESNTIKKSVTKVRKALRPAGKAAEKGAKATEYGVRKAGENTSIAAHRATGKNSVQINRGPKKDEVITPKGEHIPVSRTK